MPWDDRSGERLRTSMGFDSTTSYDEPRVAILPMAFCYQGRAASGDLPLRRRKLRAQPAEPERRALLPRNIAWFMASPCFEDELLPVLPHRVGAALRD